MQFKDFIPLVLGERNAGRLEYILRKRSADHVRRPFNGQQGRQNIWLEMLKRMEFSAVVETGTFRGSTTLFLVQSGLPIYTVEISPRYYEYSALCLRRHRNQVHLSEGDSRDFLRKAARHMGCPKSRVFFYLDAHWGNDLPLREEVEIIFENWTDSVAMIDDFAVPGMDYGYDDYGPGRRLNMEYLLPVVDELQLIPFFPSFGPDGETGFKRGCVVLCREDGIADRLKGIDLLSAYLPGSARGE